VDVLGAALPNLMFIVGVLAVGIGLGIELKFMQLNNQVPRSGRIGALVAGLMLILSSVYLYANPVATSDTTQAETAPTQMQPTLLPTTPLVAATPSPAAPAPALAPDVPTQPSAVAQVLVPDLLGMDQKGAARAVEEAGLRLGDVSAADKGKGGKKGRVLSQSPAPGTLVAPGSQVNIEVRD
jgi:hypothetical protein